MNKILKKTYTEHTEDINFLNETLFHTANGYIGVRGSVSEGVPKTWDTMRGTYINGFYDIIPMKQAENLCNFVNDKDGMLNVADTTLIRCIVDGCNLDMTAGEIKEHTRILDMENGVSKRILNWVSPYGKEIELTETRMTSFEMTNLFTVEYSVKPINFAGEIEIISSHNPNVVNYCNPNDPRTASESMKNLTVLELSQNDSFSIAVSETSSSNLKVCSAVASRVSGDAIVRKEADGTCASVYISASLKAGERVTLEKFCIFTDSIREADLKLAAEEKLRISVQNGLVHYYESQRRYLDDFWNGCAMEIEGDEALDSAVAFNMYELLQSSPKDDRCSIAAKGMSGEGYEGHYFWDAETFVLPFFIMTNPQMAQKVLEYRYSTLDKARENAKLLGHSTGALFPWRTITGRECSGYFVSGSAAYHINADIAYAVVKYYLSTGDLSFIKEKGEELLIETARLWMDVGNYNRRGEFVINEVTGPDEYTCMVDNNFYTNCAAKYNLQWAVRLFRKLQAESLSDDIMKKLSVSEKELATMEKAADAMLLLYDEDLGINPQDDSFLSKPVWNLKDTPVENFPLLLNYHPLHLYRYQVCKQADTVLAYFMFDDAASPEVQMRSFRYYEKITTHDSSLSKCIFSIVASKLGLTEEAYDYFGDSARLDLENIHDNTKHGIHTANMGGCYMAIVNGFAGLNISEKGVSAYPRLPKQWKSLKFNIKYQGRLIHFEISSNETSATLYEGKNIAVTVYGTEYLLKEKSTITCKRN